MFMAAAAFSMIIVAVAVVMMVMPVVMMKIMSVMVTILGVAMVCHRAIRMLHPAVRQMRVIMMVTVDRKPLRRRAAEQAHIFRTLAHRLRCAAAADMAVEAYHRIGFRHHYMQIMRD